MVALATVRDNHDILAEQCLAFTHDPVEHHVTCNKDTMSIADNHFVVDDELECAEVEADIVAQSSALSVMMDTWEPEMGCATDSLSVGTGLQQTGEVVRPRTEGKASSNYRVCQDVIEVVNHRRLRIGTHHGKAVYVAQVVSGIKNRMGCPKVNEANLLAVRRMAYNTMLKHGLRDSHIRDCIEMVIAGVFVPDAPDLLRAKMLASVGMASLRDEVANAGPLNAWGSLWRPFRRASERVRA